MTFGDIKKAISQGSLKLPSTATEVALIRDATNSAFARLHADFMASFYNRVTNEDLLIAGLAMCAPMQGDDLVAQFDRAMTRGWKLDMLTQQYHK